MTLAEARRRIWQRLAASARADVGNGDWMDDEAEHEADFRRLAKASEQVARTIERRHLRRRTR